MVQDSCDLIESCHVAGAPFPPLSHPVSYLPLASFDHYILSHNLLLPRPRSSSSIFRIVVVQRRGAASTRYDGRRGGHVEAGAATLGRIYTGADDAVALPPSPRH